MKRSAGEHATSILDHFNQNVQLITVYNSSPTMVSSNSFSSTKHESGSNGQPSVQSRQQVSSF